MTKEAYVFCTVLILYSFLLGMRAGYVMDKNRRKIMDKKKYITMKARLWTGVDFEDAKIVDGAWYVFKNGWIRLSEALSNRKRGLYTGLRHS